MKYWILLLLVLGGCAVQGEINLEGESSMAESTKQNDMQKDDGAIIPEVEDMQPEVIETATFAGGCFWCMEAFFQETEGVKDAISGYTGGIVENPTYSEVSRGITGHYEAIQITYDVNKITYEELVSLFWKQIDPTDAGGSFVDRGDQYKSAIFHHDDGQKEIAEKAAEATGLDLADFDNDGDLDLITVGDGYSSPGGIFLYRNNGVAFSSQPHKLSNFEATGIRAVDYDNDGDLDFLTSGDGYSCPAGIHLLTQNPFGEFKATERLSTAEGKDLTIIVAGDGYSSPAGIHEMVK